MSRGRRDKPQHVWPRYVITVDLFAAPDELVDKIIDEVENYIRSLPNPPMYQIDGTDPETGKDD